MDQQTRIDQLLEEIDQGSSRVKTVLPYYEIDNLKNHALRFGVSAQTAKRDLKKAILTRQNR